MEQLQHEGGSPAVAYVVAFLSNVVIAYVLAWLVFRTGEQTAARGLKLGALLWIGLVATTMGTEFVFEAVRSKSLSLRPAIPWWARC